MNQKCILVVEDDEGIRRGIADALRYAGFEVIEAARGGDGLARATTAEIDLLLLDLVLPEKSGLEILREVRRSRPILPVIVLTARGDEADRVEGLRLGADDYVVKPFSVKELLARIEAVMRRSPERSLPRKEIQIPSGRVDLGRAEVRFEDGELLSLSERECELLSYLAQSAGRAVSREEILARVWRIPGGGVETRTIDMHVARLREKLRDDPESPRVILTVRGKGYMLPAVELRA